MFKIFNNTAPVYISENFTLRNNVNTSINLWSSAAACLAHLSLGQNTTSTV